MPRVHKAKGKYDEVQKLLESQCYFKKKIIIGAIVRIHKKIKVSIDQYS